MTLTGDLLAMPEALIAQNRVNSARKLGQDPIAQGFYEPTLVGCERGFNDFGKMALEPCERPSLVSFHQTAIAHHIGGPDQLFAIARYGIMSAGIPIADISPSSFDARP